MQAKTRQDTPSCTGGDFSYNKSYSSGYAYGAIKRLDAYEKGIVSPLYLCFTPRQGVNSDFYLQYFEAGCFDREIYKIAQEGARNHGLLNVSTEDFFHSMLVFPPLEEQERITEILTQCDHVIELKEQKLDELKQLKKEFLRKMFPAKGCDTPEIRFPGFTGAWEQRKLIDEVTSIDTGKSKFTPQKSGVYEILGSTSVIGYDDSYDYEGDFLLTARVGANAGELYRHSGKVKISDNTVFIKGEQLDFIYYALLHFDIKRLSFGTGQPLVKASELKTQDIMMPVDSDERSAISTYFSNLDHLITLHQRELEETKTYKKTLAKLLLTGIVRVQG